MDAFSQCATGVRFALLYDGRCLTAESGFGCGVSLAPCAEASEVNATLQAWHLEVANATGAFTVHAMTKRGLEDSRACTDTAAECTSWAAAGECENNQVFMSSNCRRACGLCKSKRACSVWAHRTARVGTDRDAIQLMGRTQAPLLSLSPPGGAHAARVGMLKGPPALATQNLSARLLLGSQVDGLLCALGRRAWARVTGSAAFDDRLSTCTCRCRGGRPCSRAGTCCVRRAPA